MSTHVCITVRWIGDRFHGFSDGTDSIEWPPSPFRLFQALVASAHRHGMTDDRRQALAWMERQQDAPDVFAAAEPATGVMFDHWVPDNDNLVAHRKGSIRRFKPVLLRDCPFVRYVWPINAMDQPPFDRLYDLTATLGWFGWAVDAAFATVTLVSDELHHSEKATDSLARFRPVAKTTRTDDSLRVPKPGSAANLEDLYILNRTAFSDQTQRHKKKWPKVFDRVVYSMADRLPPRPHVVFKLVDENEDTFRYPHAKLIHIAGMVRHLAIKAMDAENGNPPPWIDNPANWVNRVVRGFRNKEAGDDHQQFSYVPLPSIGHAHSDALIRNIIIVAPIGMERELEHLANQLDGEALIAESHANKCTEESTPTLSEPIRLERFTPPRGKFISERYLGTSSVWETVTPVILDGCNRKSKTDKPEAVARATEKLVCKALARAGIDVPCQFTWQSLPFLKNALSAHKYDREGKRTGYFRPTYLQGRSAVHVRLRFDQPIVGPLTVGAGRHCGFGVFAAAEIG